MQSEVQERKSFNFPLQESIQEDVSKVFCSLQLLKHSKNINFFVRYFLIQSLILFGNSLQSKVVGKDIFV